LFEKEEEITL